LFIATNEQIHSKCVKSLDIHEHPFVVVALPHMYTRFSFYYNALRNSHRLTPRMSHNLWDTTSNISRTQGMMAVHMFSGHHQTSTGRVRAKNTIEKFCARKCRQKWCHLLAFPGWKKFWQNKGDPPTIVGGSTTLKIVCNLFPYPLP
jgi:hypothetical protein